MKTSALLLFLLSLCAPAQSRTVTLNWTASTTPGVTYNIYRATGTCPATGAAKIGSVAVGIVTYVDSTVVVGTYCYYVTAAGGGLESVPSVNAVAIVPPVAPTGLTVTPSSAILRTRDRRQFSATGGASSPTWSISPRVGSITQSGLYTAPSFVRSGTQVTIIASTANGERATALVTIRRR